MYLLVWKMAETKMIAKLVKSPNELVSYKSISHLLIISKLFVKLLIKKDRKKIFTQLIINQFGFRDRHSTINQMNRITNY